jgi:hypothetical protein
MKDPKAFLDSLEQIQYYLRMPNFCTGCMDDSLVTDASNQEASRIWEGELHTAIKEGTLLFLFKNKGTQYHGRGFEMLAALMQHCHPDTVTNAFSSLLSLFNDVQGDNESILEYQSHFNGLTLELNQCRVIIPPLLMIMLFVRALHRLLVYNLRNKKYYEPDSYRLDPYRLPGSAYPSIKYDGGLFVNLLRDDNPQFEEQYPPGTRVERIDPSTNMLLSGAVWTFPFLSISPTPPPIHQIYLTPSSLTMVPPLSQMANLIPLPLVSLTALDTTESLLPPFLRLNPRITFEHDGQYHKGYLGQLNGV